MKILLNGVDGNFGARAAKILLKKWPHEDLIFTVPTDEAKKKSPDLEIETRIADYNNPDSLVTTFTGADTVILISMPFVGPRRVKAHKNAVDAAVKAGVHKIVYTSFVGAGEKDIDTYEVNDHVWTEAYIKKQPIHYLFLRDSQYAEAMISNYVEVSEGASHVLANNFGQGEMAFVSRDDCALAAAYAAMSDWQDRVIDVNGAELLTLAEFIAIGNEVTGNNVQYDEISDDKQYEFFDSIGVPRTTEDMWAQTATNFPFCSDGMVTAGRAVRNNQMSVFTQDFEELTGQKPLTVRAMFENLSDHLIGSRTATDD